MHVVPGIESTSPRGIPRVLVALRRLAVAGLLVVHTTTFGPALAHPNPDRQIADLDRLIAARPRDATLFLRRGEIHRGLSDWKAAAADYRRVRQLDPALDAVDLCLGRMLVESRRPREAIPALDRFLAKHPDHPMAIASRARARARLGRSVQAADDFTRAIAQSQPHADPDLYLERARALAEGQEPRLDEAIRGLDEHPPQAEVDSVQRRVELTGAPVIRGGSLPVGETPVNLAPPEEKGRVTWSRGDEFVEVGDLPIRGRMGEGGAESRRQHDQKSCNRESPQGNLREDSPNSPRSLRFDAGHDVHAKPHGAMSASIRPKRND